MCEKEVNDRKRVYGLIAITLILSISLAISISLALSAKAPQANNGLYLPNQVTDNDSSDNNVKLVNFTCNAGDPYEFTVEVKVDLSDGMNKTEAEMVASAIFEHELNATYAVKSSEPHDAGIWTVNLSWEFDLPSGKPEVLGHVFDVTINPLDQTVTYSRCF